MLIHSVRRGAVVVPALGLVLAVTAPVHAATSPWGGYVAASTTYTSVAADWTQPTLKCSSAEATAAFWVGLDGYRSSSVEQAGTEVACVGGKAEYFAWYELYPQPPVELNNPLAAGDAVSATVSGTAKDVFTITVRDVTAGWSNTSTHTVSGAARSSAEVIAEVPVSGTVLPAGSGAVTFTSAKVDGAALGAADPTKLNGTDVTCGSLIGGTQFTCTWP